MFEQRFIVARDKPITAEEHDLKLPFQVFRRDAAPVVI
jgi:hypothetical protein